jgi:predicted transcriptional regulator
MGQQFMRVDEVVEILDVSPSYAYKVIRQLNDELKKQGFITIAGRVNRDYFYERLYQARKENKNACL